MVALGVAVYLSVTGLSASLTAAVLGVGGVAITAAASISVKQALQGRMKRAVLLVVLGTLLEGVVVAVILGCHLPNHVAALAPLAATHVISIVPLLLSSYMLTWLREQALHRKLDARLHDLKARTAPGSAIGGSLGLGRNSRLLLGSPGVAASANASVSMLESIRRKAAGRKVVRTMRYVCVRDLTAHHIQ